MQRTLFTGINLSFHSKCTFKMRVNWVACFDDCKNHCFLSYYLSRFKHILLVARNSTLLLADPFHTADLFLYTLKTETRCFTERKRERGSEREVERERRREGEREREKERPMAWNGLIIIIISVFFLSIQCDRIQNVDTDIKRHKNSNPSFLVNLIPREI